jgi:hypothetical protein
MAFKMKGAPFQKETKEQRKAANKSYRQSLKADRKREKEAKPYVKGTKTSSELLGKLNNPKKTEEKHDIKKGVKAMGTLAAVGAVVPKIYKKLVGPMINGVRYPASYRDE